MINTMLHRTTAGAAHQDFESKEAARAAAAGGQMPFMAGATNYTNNGPGMHTQQQHPQYNNYPTNFHQWTPEEQQKYHQQQQLAMMHPQQQQQQMMNGQLPQHGVPQHYGTNQAGPMHASSATSGISYGSGGGKKGGRGKALMNSMRNLSIGSTIRSGVQATAHAAAATANAAVATAAAVNANVKSHSSKGGVAEWETRWDADDDDDDDDDSDGEDETDSKPSAVSVATAPIHHQQQPQLQPGMDDGYQTQSPPRGAATVDPSKVQTPPSATSLQRSHLVTPIRDDRRSVSDDGLEWDTGIQQDIASKPNVQMFMPLLRVLGKGSFGKVSANFLDFSCHA